MIEISSMKCLQVVAIRFNDLQMMELFRFWCKPGVQVVVLDTQCCQVDSILKPFC